MYVDKGVEPSVGKVNLCEVLVGVAGVATQPLIITAVGVYSARRENSERGQGPVHTLKSPVGFCLFSDEDCNNNNCYSFKMRRSRTSSLLLFCLITLCFNVVRSQFIFREDPLGKFYSNKILIDVY